MIKVVVFAHLAEAADPDQVYHQACQEVMQTIAKLNAPLPAGSNDDAFSVTDLEPNFQREEFEAAVAKAKEYIVAGDVIQVVLSQKYSVI